MTENEEELIRAIKDQILFGSGAVKIEVDEEGNLVIKRASPSDINKDADDT